GLDLHVVAGARHHPLVGLEIAVKHHLAGFGVLHPEVLRRLALGIAQKRPDFGGEDVIDPAHGVPLERFHSGLGEDYGEYSQQPINAQTQPWSAHFARISSTTVATGLVAST